jgi:hypothetical protein
LTPRVDVAGVRPEQVDTIVTPRCLPDVVAVADVKLYRHYALTVPCHDGCERIGVSGAGMNTNNPSCRQRLDELVFETAIGARHQRSPAHKLHPELSVQIQDTRTSARQILGRPSSATHPGRIRQLIHVDRGSINCECMRQRGPRIADIPDAA